MPLSDLEKASTRRMPYGTKAAAGTNITRTSTGGSVGPEKVTLHQGELLQTVLAALSLTHLAKSAVNYCIASVNIPRSQALMHSQSNKCALFAAI